MFSYDPVSLTRDTNGAAHLEFRGDYQWHKIEVSTNLINWTVLTNIITGTYHTISDPGAASRPASFYRATPWP